MKALIPVAGAGTRLRPHTYTQPKPLIPVAGKPIISFIIEQLQAAGIDEFVLVIGYLGNKIKEYISDYHSSLRVTYVQQEEREGLGHAIWLSADALADEEEVFIVLGDTIFDADLRQFIQQSQSCVGVKRVEDPRQFGVAEIGDDGLVRRVVEKPKIPKSNMALVGLYKIQEVQLLMGCLDYLVTRNVRTVGEIQLTDALMLMIEQGASLVPMQVNNWFDCGKKDILLETNAMLLKRAVRSHYGSAYRDAIIIPPVYIGTGCDIRHAIIGPNVTIGDNARIMSSIISDSIIGNFASIEQVVLHRSVVGSDAAIKGLRQSFNLGDNTEIDFS